MDAETSADQLVAWWHLLWGKTGGDSEEEVAGLESKLGVRLPAVLRAVYLRTALRSSQQLHLRTILELDIADGVLRFGMEQQGCSYFGVRVGDLALPRPRVVWDGLGDGAWHALKSDLESWLRTFALINRPFEEPLLFDADYDWELLERSSWVRQELPDDWCGDWSCELWSNGEAVLDTNDGALGARDAEALRRAALSLGIDDAMHEGH